MRPEAQKLDDAFNSMLRTDYIALKDTPKLALLTQYYVDYFGYLRQVVSESDQLIVGRRGTGKTTLLYRGLIECMRSWTPEQSLAKPRTLGIYLDLSKSQALFNTTAGVIDFEYLFVSEVCEAIRSEITRSWPELEKDPSFFARLFDSAEKKQAALVKDYLNTLANVLRSGVPRLIERSGDVETKAFNQTTTGSGISGTLGSSESKLSVTADKKSDSSLEQKFGYKITYHLTIADILKIIDSLREAAKISCVVLFIDEFSALTEELQRRFTTLMKSVLGNHAGVFIKLCAITDNYKLGSAVILQRDLFEMSLDLDAFVERSGSLPAAMSELESLTAKIVSERLRVYAGIDANQLLEDPGGTWVELSRSAMGVPRTLGIVLKQAWYRAESSQRSKIQKTDIDYGIRYASKAYLNQLLGAADGSVGIPSYVADIWSAILSRANSERKKGEAASHFMILDRNDVKLKYLNMFFVVHLLTKGRTTKKEKDSRSLYSIDYGICVENNLGFATDKNVLRQQRFAFDDTLAEFDSYFQKSDEAKYVCPTCKKVFLETQLWVAGSLLKFCPSDKSDLELMSATLGGSHYTEEEIKIIGAIRSSSAEDHVTARRVADDVGCYVQKVAKFGEKLDRENIIERQKLEEIGRFTYFNPESEEPPKA